MAKRLPSCLPGSFIERKNVNGEIFLERIMDYIVSGREYE